MVIDYFPTTYFDLYSKLSQLKHNGFFLFFVNRNPHIFSQTKHMVEKIEIITVIVTQT